MSNERRGAPVIIAWLVPVLFCGAGVVPARAAEPASGAAGARDARTPVPGAAAQAAADRLVRDLYGKQFADPSARGRRELARQLLEQARKTNDDPAGRYVLLTRCLDLAIDGADVKTASEAADDLGTTYAVDAPALMADAVRRLALKVSGAGDQALLAALGMKAIDGLMTAGRYAEALPLCPVVQSAGAASGNAGLRARTAARAAFARSAGAEFERLKFSFDTLATRSDDLRANEAVGRFYFIYGDWARALPLLAKGPAGAPGGAENPWKSLAVRDLADPQSAPDRMALAAGWWDLSEHQTEPAKARVQARAALWYRRALPGLEGITRALAEKRIAAAAEAAPPGDDAGVAAGPAPESPAEAPVPAAARAGPGVTVLSARWGGGNNWSDVTVKVRERVADGKRFWANPATLGADPTPGWRKHLQITYVKDGQKKDMWVDEDQEIGLPGPGRQ